jgi:hypothetical protein
MRIDKQDIINAITASAKELQQGIDTHCCLMTSILEGKMDAHSLEPLLDLFPKSSRELKLEKAIQEAIDTIENSRKAFKSKQLEILRKKLTQVLIETD